MGGWQQDKLSERRGYSPPSLPLSWRYRPIKIRAMSEKYVGMRVRTPYKCIGQLKHDRFKNTPILLLCFYPNSCALLTDVSTINKHLPFKHSML